MPLLSGKLKKVRLKNIQTEISAGKSPKQAGAIANSKARRSKNANLSKKTRNRKSR